MPPVGPLKPAHRGWENSQSAKESKPPPPKSECLPCGSMEERQSLGTSREREGQRRREQSGRSKRVLEINDGDKDRSGQCLEWYKRTTSNMAWYKASTMTEAIDRYKKKGGLEKRSQRERLTRKKKEKSMTERKKETRQIRRAYQKPTQLSCCTRKGLDKRGC